jgi:hypothetical protein
MNPLPLGKTDNYNQLFHLSAAAQVRHTAIFGKSCTGKSTLMRNMIARDIGEGLALADPHGDLVDDLLGMIPRSRTNDVIYFKPDDPERVPGINPLRQVPDTQKPLVVSSIISILGNIWKEFGDRRRNAFSPIWSPDESAKQILESSKPLPLSI